MPRKTSKKKRGLKGLRETPETNRQSRLASMESDHLRKQSRAAKKIQSMTRGRQTRKGIQKKHDEFMETYNDRVDPNIMSKIFYETVFDEDIMDRRDSLEELEKKHVRNVELQKKMNTNFAFHPNYNKLEDTGLFKSEALGQGKFYTREGDLLSYDDFVNYQGPGRQMLVQNSKSLDSDSSDYDKKKQIRDWHDKNLHNIMDQDDIVDANKDDIADKKDRLNVLEELDIFKCKNMKNLLDADPQLYLNQDIKHFSDICRNDRTQIFVNTFFKIRWELIMPVDSRNGGIEAKISHFPDSKLDWRRKDSLIHALVDEGLLTLNQDHQWPAAARPPDTTLNRFDVLANYFKWSDGSNQRIALRHLQGSPSIVKVMDGRTHLNRVLDRFTEKCNRIHEIFKKTSGYHITPEKIEKIKRFFILSLIGLDIPDNYITELKKKMSRNMNNLSRLNQFDIPEESKKIVYLEMLRDGKHIDDDDRKFIDNIAINIAYFGSLEKALEDFTKTLNEFKFRRNVEKRKKRDYDEMLEYAQELLHTFYG